MAQLNVKQWVDESAEAYGNKAANLMVMEKGFADINIPDICPLSHMMCLKHLDTHYPGWRAQWEAFKEKQGNESGGLAEGTHEILSQLRAGIEQVFGEYPLEDERISEYLASHFEPGEVLMVRSTGKEDSAELANPGGNESYAGISANIDSVSAACGRVIASYFSEKSLEQRLKAKHVESDSIMGEPFMPVLLQKMIGEVIVADKITSAKKVYSGVMYVNQDGKVTIQEAPGHGELVVNSKGPINSYFILGEGTVHQQVNEKPFRMVSYINEAGKAELIVKKNTNEIKNASLPKEVVERLGKMGKEIQAFYGDDRDIEFVYDEHADKIFIVQARPIPLGESTRHIPSAISPEKIREVKKEVPYYKAKTIAVAASKVELAENSGDVIICNTIGDALTMYLDMKDPKIKAVVVARDAPSTSHEAAEFNSVSIPVFYVDKAQKERIQSSLEQGDKQFLFDPQRGLIVDWSGKGSSEEILKEGLFKSSISAERTLLPESKMLFSENSILQAEKLLQGAEKKKGMSYEQLIDQLEIVESTTPQTIIQSREALKQVLMDIIDTCRVAHVNDTQIDKDLKSNILKHAIAYSLDVDTLLTKIESQQGNVINDKDQKQLLDLSNGLEALIANPGRTGLYSDSVYNLMQDFALKSRLNENYPIYTRLPEENRKVVEAVALFGKNAANDELRDKWERFVIQVAVTDRGSQEENLEKLASVVYFAQANDLGSVLINNVFSQLDTSDFSKTIEALNQATNQLTPYAGRIFDLETKAAELEAKAVLWSKKKNHEKLIKEYGKDVADIIRYIDSFGPLHELPLLAKAKVLGEIAKITEIMDGSIKTMKGCQDYPNEDKVLKSEQAGLFYKMLDPYCDLMIKVVENISEGRRDSIKSAADRCSTIIPNMHSIKQYLNEKSDINDAAELSTSGRFAVNSSIITSGTQFNVQFKKRNLHLEDYFTLFHQNIIAAISLIGPDLNLPDNVFPEKLKVVNSEMQKNKGIYRSKLIESKIENGNIVLSYNIPLNSHAAKIFISYDIRTEDLRMTVEFYGLNEKPYGNYVPRMTLIEHFLEKIPQESTHFTQESMLPYDDKKMSLSSIFRVNLKEEQALRDVLVMKQLIDECCEVTFCIPKIPENPWMFDVNLIADNTIKSYASYYEINDRINQDIDSAMVFLLFVMSSKNYFDLKTALEVINDQNGKLKSNIENLMFEITGNKIELRQLIEDLDEGDFRGAIKSHLILRYLQKYNAIGRYQDDFTSILGRDEKLAESIMDAMISKNIDLKFIKPALEGHTRLSGKLRDYLNEKEREERFESVIVNITKNGVIDESTLSELSNEDESCIYKVACRITDGPFNPAISFIVRYCQELSNDQVHEYLQRLFNSQDVVKYSIGYLKDMHEIIQGLKGNPFYSVELKLLVEDFEKKLYSQICLKEPMDKAKSQEKVLKKSKSKEQESHESESSDLVEIKRHLSAMQTATDKIHIIAFKKLLRNKVGILENMMQEGVINLVNEKFILENNNDILYLLDFSLVNTDEELKNVMVRLLRVDILSNELINTLLVFSNTHQLEKSAQLLQIIKNERELGNENMKPMTTSYNKIKKGEKHKKEHIEAIDPDQRPSGAGKKM